jgi:hypothetical protein
VGEAGADALSSAGVEIVTDVPNIVRWFRIHRNHHQVHRNRTEYVVLEAWWVTSPFAIFEGGTNMSDLNTNQNISVLGSNISLLKTKSFSHFIFAPKSLMNHLA